MSSPTSPQYPASSPSTSSPSSLPVWHFPFGPSSRYHNSERSKLSHHSRTKTTHGRAPILSTEQRARRRAQNSSYPTPPLSESSEYCRSPLSRFSSYSNPATMASTVKNGAPFTPAKTPRRKSSLQDSPFSDYFSDDARSAMSATAPSSETKALLVRMNKLQSRIMRDSSKDGAEAIRIVGLKLTEIEQQLNTLQNQTRLPTELDDSGMFMAEDKNVLPFLQGNEDYNLVAPMQHSREPSIQSLNSSIGSSLIFSEDGATLKQYRAERDWYLLRMQELLENLNDVQTELRQRQLEVKELHDLHSSSMEEKEEQIEQLRSENEGLRQDLGFEYSELLFLKLQLKSMEVDIDDLRSDDVIIDTAAERQKREKKNRILSEMDRWRTDSDWQDVEARFRRRRSKYGIPSSHICKTSDLETDAAGEIDWSLETVREGEGRGRVTSLTIKRTSSNRSVPKVEDESEAAQHAVTLGGTTDVLHSKARQLETSRTNSPQEAMAEHITAQQQIRTIEYAEAWTQTDITLQPYPLDEDLFSETPRGEDEEEEGNVEEEDDCAITSSSEADAEQYQDVEEDDKTIVQDPILRMPQKSAWQELWSSLSSLTGLPDEEEDEY